MGDDFFQAVPIPTPAGAPQWADRVAQLLGAVVQRLNAVPPSEPAEEQRARKLCSRLILQNRLVASALGACRCWGLSPRCIECGGVGRPGSFEVDTAAFEAFVAPLVRAQPQLFVAHLSQVQDDARQAVHANQGEHNGIRIQ